MNLRHPSRWTLRTRLVAAILALFVVVSAATGAITVYALDRSLTDRLDQTLRQTAARSAGAPPPGLGGPPPPGLDGQALRVVQRTGVVTANAVYAADGTRTALSAAQLALLPAASARPRSIDLGGGLGTYRVVALRTAAGDLVVNGLPLAPVRETVWRLAAIVGAVSGAGLVAVALLSALLVRSALRPLRRVAATAARVSALPLASGEVNLGERVPAADTDPHTEVGQVGAALNDMLDHVDAALTARHDSEQRVRRFVADASHELRTPLASIRGYAELTRRDATPAPAPIAHALERVESEAVRMAGLVDDMLLLARLDSGRPLERAPVDLTAIAVNAVSDARAAGPEHRWELALPDEPVVVPGDADRLTQVVVNLLANARVHTPGGTRVTLRLARDGERAVVEVADDGPGIPAAIQGTVFERFVRGDHARTRADGSTGLGLSIVAAVARAHGGAAVVASAAGRTVFTVTLPASADPAG